MTGKLSTEEVIRELLRTYTDAATPGGGGQGIRTAGGDDAVLWMSKAYHEGSYAQLEQALRRMRNQGSQKAVQGIPLRTLWWHLSERYIRVQQVNRNVYVTRRNDKGKKFKSLDRQRFFVYGREYAAVPKAKQEICDRLGVGWLAEEFSRMGVVPFLPSETWERVAA